MTADERPVTGWARAWRALKDPAGEDFKRLVEVAQKVLAMVAVLVGAGVFVGTGGFRAAIVQLRLLEAELARSDGPALQVAAGEARTEHGADGPFAVFPYTLKNVGSEALALHVQVWLLPVYGMGHDVDVGDAPLSAACAPWLLDGNAWSRHDNPVRRVCTDVGNWLVASNPSKQDAGGAAYTAVAPGVTEAGAVVVPVRCSALWYAVRVVAFQDGGGLQWTADDVFVPACED